MCVYVCQCVCVCEREREREREREKREVGREGEYTDSPRNSSKDFQAAFENDFSAEPCDRSWLLLRDLDLEAEPVPDSTDLGVDAALPPPDAERDARAAGSGLAVVDFDADLRVLVDP
jgi:hypothetical protein